MRQQGQSTTSGLTNPPRHNTCRTPSTQERIPMVMTCHHRNSCTATKAHREIPHRSSLARHFRHGHEQRLIRDVHTDGWCRIQCRDTRSLFLDYGHPGSLCDHPTTLVSSCPTVPLCSIIGKLIEITLRANSQTLQQQMHARNLHPKRVA